MSAPERIPAGRLSPVEPATADGGRAAEPAAPAGEPAGSLAPDLLARGELTVRGRIPDASNAVLYCTVALDGRTADCVYKPVAGERPLWDFPDGTLAEREVAAYEVARACGWDLIPTTVLRDGPYGTGMVQEWIAPPGDGDEVPELLALVAEDEPAPGWKAVGRAEIGAGRTALLVHADHPRLRRLAVLDAVINNGDRKGGHLLPAAGGSFFAIDHGVTFHSDDKLRTLLWGWAGEPLTDEARTVLAGLRTALADAAPLAARLAELITGAELAAVRARVEGLLRSGRHPEPSGEWPAIPWPPV
ncbi:SCO1664 family protein [Streptomyces sp. RS10V-4]|uniref:SCO1664 family protein n=1 Tax=Streptomyces rhizoryzae TaxID=2932493 RepID=UPI0020041373|nr:SCO1664 family protein [Streptomyces rhizoryzae]MCK7623129.1 SCO1664 family protein [Streptomyces rhizoryzae]